MQKGRAGGRGRPQGQAPPLPAQRPNGQSGRESSPLRRARGRTRRGCLRSPAAAAAPWWPPNRPGARPAAPPTLAPLPARARRAAAAARGAPTRPPATRRGAAAGAATAAAGRHRSGESTGRGAGRGLARSPSLPVASSRGRRAAAGSAPRRPPPPGGFSRGGRRPPPRAGAMLLYTINHLVRELACLQLRAQVRDALEQPLQWLAQPRRHDQGVATRLSSILTCCLAVAPRSGCVAAWLLGCMCHGSWLWTLGCRLELASGPRCWSARQPPAPDGWPPPISHGAPLSLMCTREMHAHAHIRAPCQPPTHPATHPPHKPTPPSTGACWAKASSPSALPAT
jgi:hypothetical protein